MEVNATIVNSTPFPTRAIITDDPTHESHQWVIVSTEVKDVFELVNLVGLTAAIGLFGICTNVINIVVFVRMGFRDVINISLFALTLADLIGLVVLEWFAVCINPYFRRADLPFVPAEILYVTAGWPHSCFMKITCLITAFVNLERCLCIALPLKVKTLLTPVRALFAVVLIVIFVFGSVIPAYMNVQFQWRFETAQNRDVLGIFIDKSRSNIANIAFIVNTVMQVIAFGSVIVTTIILVKKIRQKVEWRSATAAYGKGGDNSNSVSAKDRALVKMIVLMSVILIACCTPGSICYVIALMTREFSVTGRYKNIYFVAWSFAYVADAINPSVSIFLYLTMSSQYRKAFNAIFRRHSKMADTEDSSTSRSCVTTTVEKTKCPDGDRH